MMYIGINIGENGARMLCEGMKSNSTLTSLDLRSEEEKQKEERKQTKKRRNIDRKKKQERIKM